MNESTQNVEKNKLIQIIQNTPANLLKYSEVPFSYITIKIPKRWKWKLHPDLKKEGYQENKLEKLIIDKMKELNLFQNEEEIEHVRKMNVKGYGGYAFCSGNWHRLYLNSFYVTLWLYWDDKEVENSNKELEDFQEILSAIACDPVSDDADCYTLAWSYIANELKEDGASKEYMERLSRQMRQWLMYAIQERKRAAEVEKNPSFIDTITYSDYFHQRMVTIGMIPTAQLVEEDVGFKRMMKYTHIPEIDELIECSGYLVAYMNELVSAVKDTKQNYSNLIWLHVYKYETSIEESMQYIVDKHKETIKKYDQLEEIILRKLEDIYQAEKKKHDVVYKNWGQTKKNIIHELQDLTKLVNKNNLTENDLEKTEDMLGMLEEFKEIVKIKIGNELKRIEEDKEKVKEWIQVLRLTSSGFEYWHISAPRYNSHTIFENGKFLQTTMDIEKDNEEKETIVTKGPRVPVIIHHGKPHEKSS